MPEGYIVAESSGLVAVAAAEGVGLSQRMWYENVVAEARSMMVVVVY